MFDEERQRNMWACPTSAFSLYKLSLNSHQCFNCHFNSSNTNTRNVMMMMMMMNNEPFIILIIIIIIVVIIITIVSIIH